MWFTQFILSILLHSYPPPITTSDQLVKAMQKRYAGKWARTITFTQQNTHYTADTVKGKSVWYEAIEYPDKFRIDFGEIQEGNAVIFARDSVYNFKAGLLKAKRKQANNLMLLAGGIYFMSAEEAKKRLQEAGFQLDKFRTDTWQGQRVYVVGATAGDLTSAQFWIDQEKLYLVRTINPTPDHHVQDAQFSKHIQTAGGWTETEVLFLKDGKAEQREEYQGIQANVPLPAGLFEEAQFGKTHWKK